MKRFEYDNVPPVRVAEGLLKGYLYDDIYIFKGVPYAKAKRFHMPEPVTPWSGIRNATTYGYICPQTSDTLGDELMTAHRLWYQDENCQNLNIWTPSLDRNANKPVLVWLHGGGYVVGSAIEQIVYEGSNLSKFGDVVVVSVNQRVGLLGYLNLSKYGGPYDNSCNAGHADLVAALHWIRINIAAFGGNPDNITLFGQSGGGMKIADLLQIPAADGLFHKAVIMSGINKGNISPICEDDGTILAEIILRELEIQQEHVEDLEKVPYPMLLTVYQKHLHEVFLKGYGGSPVKNDYFYGNPLVYGLRQHAYEIPLIIGSVICEFDPWLNANDRNDIAESELTQKVGKRYGGHAQQVIQAFQEVYPDKNPVNVISLDRAIRPEAIKFAKMHAQGKNANTYLYNFTSTFNYENHKMAWHCSDIPFFFHNTELSEVSQMEGITDRLETQMAGSLISFAKTGNPNHPDIPEWPQVTKKNTPTMIFDKTCRVGDSYDDKLYSLIDSILPPFSNLDLVGDRI